MHRSLGFVLAASCAVVALAACGSSSKSSSPTTTAPAAASATTTAPSASGPAITIKTAGSTFAFATTPVAAGATVTIKNETDAQHTVTADTTEGGFDVTVDAGKTATFTAPKQAGAYGFHCNIHTNMQAKLTVT